MRPGIPILVSMLMLACSSRTKGQTPKQAHGQAQSETVNITFITRKGTYRIRAEVAKTMAKRELGLMFRKKLADNRGMLFVFPSERINTFWMKNTLIPLDMVFMDAKLKVVGVVHNARPLDETPVGVKQPSKFVVEIPAGQAALHGIRAGSRVVIRPTVPQAME